VAICEHHTRALRGCSSDRLTPGTHACFLEVSFVKHAQLLILSQRNAHHSAKYITKGPRFLA
jgi:hypothetical protein